MSAHAHATAGDAGFGDALRLSQFLNQVSSCAFANVLCCTYVIGTPLWVFTIFSHLLIKSWPAQVGFGGFKTRRVGSNHGNMTIMFPIPPL